MSDIQEENKQSSLNQIILLQKYEAQATLDAGLAAAGPALADIPNFYSGQAQMLIGQVQG